MYHCFLLLGSNQGNRLDLINQAIHKIEEGIGRVENTSSVYETEAWGFKSEQDFLNMVVEIRTELTAGDVLNEILGIEKELGRVRNSKVYASRLIDIDILFFDDEIVNESQLRIPHPRLHERMFTLKPMMEICPGKIHPVFHETVEQLVEKCDDELKVKMIKPKKNLFAGN